VLENQKQMGNGKDNETTEEQLTLNSITHSKKTTVNKSSNHSNYKYSGEFNKFYTSDNGQEEEHTLGESICSPVDRSKLGTKRHILTNKKGIPLSAAISSASTHNINLVTDVIDNTIIRRRPSSSHKSKLGTRRLQHQCLDKAYHSEPEEQELNKRG
jgi:hypothetical protein